MLCATCARAVEERSEADARVYYCEARRCWISACSACGFFLVMEAIPLPVLRDAVIGLYRARLQEKRWPKDAATRVDLARQAAERVMMSRGHAVVERRVRLYAGEAHRAVFGHSPSL